MPDDQTDAPRKAPLSTRLKLALQSHVIAQAAHFEKGNVVKAREHEQHAEAIRDAISAAARREKSTKPARIPAIEEVKLYASELGLPNSEAEHFFDHYESNGWKVGRNPIQNWQAALRNWKKRIEEKEGPIRNGTRPHGPKADPADWRQFLSDKSYPYVKFDGCREYLERELFEWRKQRRNSR